MMAAMSASRLGCYSIRRMEPAINNFSAMIAPNLERLNQQRRRLENYRRAGDSERLTAEHNNAYRTVQQLKAYIQGIDRAKSHIREEDHPEFDERVTPIMDEVIIAMNQYLELCGTDIPLAPFESFQNNELEVDDYVIVSLSDLEEHEENPDAASDTIMDNISYGTAQQQIQQQMPDNDQEAWETLTEDLQLLNQVIHEFHQSVNSQQESVDSITENIDRANQNLTEGVLKLIEIARQNAEKLPRKGAGIGFLVSAFIGYMLGAWGAGGACAIIGSHIGYYIGRLLKERQLQIIQNDLDALGK